MAEEFKDAPWNMDVDDDELRYSLADYWADRGKQEALISGRLPGGANWTTSLVLSHYKNYFPWTWFQGRFGIGKQLGFAELLASQIMITVPVALLILLGLCTFCGLMYLLCYKMKIQMKATDLQAHKLHWKWVTGALVISGCSAVMASCLMFQQSSAPVVKSGIDTFTRITTYSLDDMDMYRKRIILEKDYFFDTYLERNFFSLYNLKGVIERMKEMLQFPQLSQIQKDAILSISDSDRSLSYLRASVYPMLDTSADLIQSIADSVPEIELELQQLRIDCEVLSSISCPLPADDNISITLPKLNTLNSLDDAFMAVNWTNAKNLLRITEAYFTSYMSNGVLGQSIEAIASRVKSEAKTVHKLNYDLNEGLPLTEEFAAGPRYFWKSFQEIQRRFGTLAFFLFLGVTLGCAIYSTLIIFTFLFAVLGTRHSKFPCYQRTSTATTSANFMLTFNYITVALILPVTGLAALTLVCGTVATVLADSIYSKAIFDKIIDVTPRLNHTFIISNVTIEVDSYREVLEYCEKGDPGLLYALNITPPSFNVTIKTQLLDVGSNTARLSNVFQSLSRYVTSQRIEEEISVFLTAAVPSISANIAPNSTQKKSVFHNKSLQFTNVSQYYTLQADMQNNSAIRSDLLSLSSGYHNISTQLNSLDVQMAELAQNLKAIDTDIATMVDHYNSIKESAHVVQQNIGNLQSIFINSTDTDLESLVQIAVDRLTLVDGVFVNRSLAVLKANMGRCGHLAFIYGVISELCFFTATRYGNVIWFALIILSISLSTTAFACIIMHRYFGAYENIDYTTEEKKIELSTKSSTLPLTDGNRFRTRAIRARIARLFTSSKPGRTRAKHKASSARYEKVVGDMISTAVSESTPPVDPLYKSDTDPDLDLLTLSDIGRISLSLAFSDMSTPLVLPSHQESEPKLAKPLVKEPFLKEKHKVTVKKQAKKKQVESVPNVEPTINVWKSLESDKQQRALGESFWFTKWKGTQGEDVIEPNIADASQNYKEQMVMKSNKRDDKKSIPHLEKQVADNAAAVKQKPSHQSGQHSSVGIKSKLDNVEEDINFENAVSVNSVQLDTRDADDTQSMESFTDGQISTWIATSKHFSSEFAAIKSGKSLIQSTAIGRTETAKEFASYGNERNQSTEGNPVSPVKIDLQEDSAIYKSKLRQSSIYHSATNILLEDSARSGVKVDADNDLIEDHIRGNTDEVLDRKSFRRDTPNADSGYVFQSFVSMKTVGYGMESFDTLKDAADSNDEIAAKDDSKAKDL